MAWQFVPGEILTATNLNAVTVPWNAVCQLSMSAGQALASGSNVAVVFDTEDLDPRGWHSGSLTTITPSIAGWYQASLAWDWGTDSDYTRRLVEVQKNGAAFTPNYRDDPGSSGISVGVYSSTLLTPLISMNGSSDTLRVVGNQANTSAATNTLRVVFAAWLVYPT